MKQRDNKSNPKKVQLEKSVPREKVQHGIYAA